MPAAEDEHDRETPLRRIDLAWRVVVVVAIVAGIASFIVAVHGTGGTGDSAADAQTRAAADGTPATIATAVKRSVDIYGHLGDGAPWTRMTNPNRQGAPLVFLVLRRTSGWLHVLLPTRPNGARGWIKASDVGLSKTDYRVDISLRRHRVVVHKGARTVVDRAAAVGAPKTPTPTGRFFVTVLLRPPDPKGAYGPYAFGLSAHSDKLFHFGGGPGQIGMHGTDEPKALGHAVSNGCVRLSDATVGKLAKLLPLGTPVTIAS